MNKKKIPKSNVKFDFGYILHRTQPFPKVEPALLNSFFDEELLASFDPAVESCFLVGFLAIKSPQF